MKSARIPMAPVMTTSLSTVTLLAYSLFGLPLALVALPVYVFVPQFYATQFGLSLSIIGGTLLLTRLFDAFIDPAIGLWIDKRKASSGYPLFILVALPLLIFGFICLFNPPESAIPRASSGHATDGLQSLLPLLWFAISLLVVYLGFSLATIAHQSWGAALTQARGERARLSAMREAAGLVGVIIAAALPGLFGINALTVTFVVSLLIAAFILLRYVPAATKTGIDTLIKTATNTVSNPAANTAPFSWASIVSPFRLPTFRWLFGIFMLNGIAAAIPATLFLFFANDRLGLPQYAGLFLIVYFVAAALSMPIWVNLAKRKGEKTAWLIALCLAIAAFVWAYFLPHGAINGYAIICMISGFALGADLALPPALLVAVIAKAGDIGKREGAYFGLWSWATKMNLALAAGIALPLLEQLGYTPGTANPQGLHALAISYALVPCGLKAIAALLLWRAPLRDV